MKKYIIISAIICLAPIAYATSVKFSALPEATTLAGTEIVPIVQGGVNKTATHSLITSGNVTAAHFNAYSASRQAEIIARAKLRMQATFSSLSTTGNISAQSNITGSIITATGKIVAPFLQGTNVSTDSTGMIAGKQLGHYGSSSYNNISSIIKHSKTPIPVACGTDPATAIFDGSPALSCAIDGGSLAFTYDMNGANPLPAMLPYTVKLYEVGLTATPITPDSYHWAVPASNTLLTMGNYSTQSTFTPIRFGTYSASKSNNWIKATLTKGLKTCIAMIPVAATKIGETGAPGAKGDGASITVGTTTTLAYNQSAYVLFTGPSTARIANFGIPQGAPGEAAGVTRSSVTTAFSITAADSALILKPTSAGSITMLDVRDSSANTRLGITSTGLIVVKDAAGNIRWGFDPATNAMTMRRGGNVIFEIASTGRTTWRRPNGTAIMKLYTTGRLEL